MTQMPCENCQYYTTFENGCVSCYAQKDIEFYWNSYIDEMMKTCPKGYRAKKLGENQFSYYRDYNAVEKI